MASFTIHVPGEGIDPLQRGDKIAFVRDGFSWGAFVFGPLYFLRHRCFIAAAAWIVGVIVIGWIMHRLHMPQPADILLALLIQFFVGLEASSVRRLALHRRGLDIGGIVNARSLEEGEAAFFRAAGTRVPGPAASPFGPLRAGRPAQNSVIGLFPEPGA